MPIEKGMFEKDKIKKSPADDLKPVVKNIEKVMKNIPKIPEEISIDNFDEVKLHLRDELAIAVKKLNGIVKSIKTPESIKVSNFPPSKLAVTVLPTEDIKIYDLNLIVKAISNLEAVMAQKEFSPKIAVKSPDVHVPVPQVTVNPHMKMDSTKLLKALDPLRFLSDRPDKPIAVQISDGHKFVKALKKATNDLMTITSGGYGMTSDEWKTAYKSLRVNPTFYHGSKSSIGTSAVQMTTTSRVATNGVLVKAGVSNSGTIYAGNSSSVTAGSVDTTDGFEMRAGESIVLPVDNVNLIYLIGSAAGQKAFWMVT